MRSHARTLVGLTAVLLGLASLSPAGEPKKKEEIKENAYYEFTGRIYDRSTIEQNFTLYWTAGSQPIYVTRDTKIYRKGQAAKLQDVKSGDAVRGVGQVRKGRLTALAVAFGDEGVELPPGAKVPQSISLHQGE